MQEQFGTENSPNTLTSKIPLVSKFNITGHDTNWGRQVRRHPRICGEQRNLRMPRKAMFSSIQLCREDSDVLYVLQIVEAVASMKKGPYLSISH